MPTSSIGASLQSLVNQMHRSDPERIQLHPSGLAAFDECGEAWRRTYEAGDRGLPNEFLIVGSGLDAAVTADLQNKLNCGQLLAEEQMVSIAVDRVRLGFLGRTSIRKRDLPRVRQESEQRVVAFARYAHRKLNPNIHVKSVQRSWSVRLDAMLERRGGLEGKWAKIDLVGTLDIEEWLYDFAHGDEPVGVVVRDIKTSRAGPPRGAANGKHWLQLCAYALGLFVNDGKIPLRVQIDTLVTGPHGVRHIPSFGERDKFDFAALFNRIVRFAQARQSGMYMPAPRSSWKCTPEWCGHFSSCSFVSNKKTIDLALPPLRLYNILNTCNDAKPEPAINFLQWPKKEEQCHEHEKERNRKSLPSSMPKL